MEKSITLWEQFYGKDPKDKSEAQKTADLQQARVSVAEKYLRGDRERATIEAELTEQRKKLGTPSYDLNAITALLAKLHSLTWTQELMAKEFEETFGIKVDVIMNALKA
ncbi:MAG TPA: hypothetical protein PKN48_01200 [Bacteroidales bacterium]|nr:hypothetical protein [Bacteroidales bacterium]